MFLQTVRDVMYLFISH